MGVTTTEETSITPLQRFRLLLDSGSGQPLLHFLPIKDNVHFFSASVIFHFKKQKKRGRKMDVT